MNVDRYIELEQETKSIIGGAFVKAFNKNRADFVLLMARGGYHKHLDRPDIDVTPFVLEDRADFLMDLTRKKFFIRYLNNYIERLKNGNTMSGDDMEYEVTTQLMIYSHIWESHLFLNQLARLAGSHLMAKKRKSGSGICKRGKCDYELRSIDLSYVLGTPSFRGTYSYHLLLGKYGA